MRILLIAFYFAPLNKVASIRPSKLCKYWVRQGHEVTVLTADNEKAYPLLDKSLLCAEVLQSRVIRTPYLSRSGIKRLLLPKKPISSTNPVQNVAKANDAGAESKPKRSGFRQVAEWTRRYFNEDNRSWYWMARAPLRRLLREEHFDMIFSTFGPMNCHRLGLYAKKLSPASTWIADFRDPYSNTDNLDISKTRKRMWETEERNVYRHSDAVTFVSKGISKAIYKAGIDKPVTIVTNGYDSEDRTAASTDTISYDKQYKLTITYTGSIYAHLQDPSALFAALRNLIDAGEIGEAELQLVYAGYHGHILKGFASKYGLDGIVKDFGPVSRNESLRLQNNTDALLLITMNRVGMQGVLTGKCFEYFMSGKPILAIVNGDLPESEIAGIINENHLGVVWEQANGPRDMAKLQGFIKMLIHSQLPPMSARNAAGLSKYEYSNIARQITEIVETTANQA